MHVYIVDLVCGQHLLINHTLNNMHVERNVFYNVLRTMLGEKKTNVVVRRICGMCTYDQFVVVGLTWHPLG